MSDDAKMREEWLTTKEDREAAAKVGSWLADDFHAGTWENGFVSNLAKDAIRAISELAEAREWLQKIVEGDTIMSRKEMAEAALRRDEVNPPYDREGLNASIREQLRRDEEKSS